MEKILAKKDYFYIEKSVDLFWNGAISARGAIKKRVDYTMLYSWKKLLTKDVTTLWLIIFLHLIWLSLKVHWKWHIIGKNNNLDLDIGQPK